MGQEIYGSGLPFCLVPRHYHRLDDEGFIVYDSTIINEYLEDEYPYPALMPEGSEGRARARMMEDFRDTHFNPHFVKLLNEMRKPETERDASVVGNAKAEIAKCFDRIEKELQGREYLAGSFSLADIAFMANFDLLDRFQVTVDAKYSNTIAWIARLKARSSFAASAS